MFVILVCCSHFASDIFADDDTIDEDLLDQQEIRESLAALTARPEYFIEEPGSRSEITICERAKTVQNEEPLDRMQQSQEDQPTEDSLDESNLSNASNV